MRDAADRGIIRAIVVTPPRAPLESLLALIRPFVDICLLRTGPQDLPASSTLLGLTLAAYTLSNLVGGIVSFGVKDAVAASLLDTGLLVALTASVLCAHRLRARVVQTLTALAGCGTLLMLIAIPLSWVQLSTGPDNQLGLASLMFLALWVWNLVVFGHILRHALSAPLFVGLIVAGIFFAVFYMTFFQLFPPQA